MDIIMYGYGRPIYMELSLNSLCFNIEPRNNIHIVLNQSTQTPIEITKLMGIVNRFSNHIKTIMVLDGNYFHTALNAMTQYLISTNSLSRNICITEDDLIIPPYFKSYYGDFTNTLEMGLTKSTITGVRLDDTNYYTGPDLLTKQDISPVLFEHYKNVGDIAGHFLTMETSLYLDSCQVFKRSPLDVELMTHAKKLNNREYYSLVLDRPVYHLGWNREMDYPEYYKELVAQRNAENWGRVIACPNKKSRTIFFWNKGKVEENIELEWTWK